MPYRNNVVSLKTCLSLMEAKLVSDGGGAVEGGDGGRGVRERGGRAREICRIVV